MCDVTFQGVLPLFSVMRIKIVLFCSYYYHLSSANSGEHHNIKERYKDNMIVTQILKIRYKNETQNRCKHTTYKSQFKIDTTGRKAKMSQFKCSLCIISREETWRCRHLVHIRLAWAKFRARQVYTKFRCLLTHGCRHCDLLLQHS